MYKQHLCPECDLSPPLLWTAWGFSPAFFNSFHGDQNEIL